MLSGLRESGARPGPPTRPRRVFPSCPEPRACRRCLLRSRRAQHRRHSLQLPRHPRRASRTVECPERPALGQRRAQQPCWPRLRRQLASGHFTSAQGFGQSCPGNAFCAAAFISALSHRLLVVILRWPVVISTRRQEGAIQGRQVTESAIPVARPRPESPPQNGRLQNCVYKFITDHVKNVKSYNSLHNQDR